MKLRTICKNPRCRKVYYVDLINEPTKLECCSKECSGQLFILVGGGSNPYGVNVRDIANKIPDFRLHPEILRARGHI